MINAVLGVSLSITKGDGQETVVGVIIVSVLERMRNSMVKSQEPHSKPKSFILGVEIEKNGRQV